MNRNRSDVEVDLGSTAREVPYATSTINTVNANDTMVVVSNRSGGRDEDIVFTVPKSLVKTSISMRRNYWRRPTMIQDSLVLMVFIII